MQILMLEPIHTPRVPNVIENRDNDFLDNYVTLGAPTSITKFRGI